MAQPKLLLCHAFDSLRAADQTALRGTKSELSKERKLFWRTAFTHYMRAIDYFESVVQSPAADKKAKDLSSEKLAYAIDQAEHLNSQIASLLRGPLDPPAYEEDGLIPDDPAFQRSADQKLRPGEALTATITLQPDSTYEIDVRNLSPKPALSVVGISLDVECVLLDSRRRTFSSRLPPQTAWSHRAVTAKSETFSGPVTLALRIRPNSIVRAGKLSVCVVRVTSPVPRPAIFHHPSSELSATIAGSSPAGTRTGTQLPTRDQPNPPSSCPPLLDPTRFDDVAVDVAALPMPPSDEPLAATASATVDVPATSAFFLAQDVADGMFSDLPIEDFEEEASPSALHAGAPPLSADGGASLSPDGIGDIAGLPVDETVPSTPVVRPPAGVVLSSRAPLPFAPQRQPAVSPAIPMSTAAAVIPPDFDFSARLAAITGRAPASLSTIAAAPPAGDATIAQPINSRSDVVAGVNEDAEVADTLQDLGLLSSATGDAGGSDDVAPPFEFGDNLDVSQFECEGCEDGVVDGQVCPLCLGTSVSEGNVDRWVAAMSSATKRGSSIALLFWEEQYSREKLVCESHSAELEALRLFFDPVYIDVRAGCLEESIGTCQVLAFFTKRLWEALHAVDLDNNRHRRDPLHGKAGLLQLPERVHLKPLSTCRLCGDPLEKAFAGKLCCIDCDCINNPKFPLVMSTRCFAPDCVASAVPMTPRCRLHLGAASKTL